MTLRLVHLPVQRLPAGQTRHPAISVSPTEQHSAGPLRVTNNNTSLERLSSFDIAHLNPWILAISFSSWRSWGRMLTDWFLMRDRRTGPSPYICSSYFLNITTSKFLNFLFNKPIFIWQSYLWKCSSFTWRSQGACLCSCSTPPRWWHGYFVYRQVWKLEETLNLGEIRENILDRKLQFILVFKKEIEF